MRQRACHWRSSAIGKPPEPNHDAMGRLGFALCHRFPTEVSLAGPPAASVVRRKSLSGCVLVNIATCSVRAPRGSIDSGKHDAS